MLLEKKRVSEYYCWWGAWRSFFRKRQKVSTAANDHRKTQQASHKKELELELQGAARDA